MQREQIFALHLVPRPRYSLIAIHDPPLLNF